MPIDPFFLQTIQQSSKIKANPSASNGSQAVPVMQPTHTSSISAQARPPPGRDAEIVYTLCNIVQCLNDSGAGTPPIGAAGNQKSQQANSKRAPQSGFGVKRRMNRASYLVDLRMAQET